MDCRLRAVKVFMNRFFGRIAPLVDSVAAVCLCRRILKSLKNLRVSVSVIVVVESNHLIFLPRYAARIDFNTSPGRNGSMHALIPAIRLEPVSCMNQISPKA